ncbi:MAG: hypothetical protein SFV17_21485 [Candidatus Obscuribacter sp.]|nr:hypothetical protein [Candidatus Obscuribacter sp.]
MSSINEKLYGVAAVLRAQAGNVAVSMCNALTTKLAAIPNMNGKLAAETFEGIISRSCNFSAMKPVRDELKAIEIVEKLLRALEADGNAVLEYEFEVQDFYEARSMSDDALFATTPSGGLAILLKTLKEQGVTWQWAPRSILSRAKIVIVRS